MKSKICCLLIIVSTTYVFSQTKKEQIDILTNRIDSLNLELNKANLAIKTLESDLGGVNTQYQDCKKSKSEIELELTKKSNIVNSLNAKIDSIYLVNSEYSSVKIGNNTWTTRNLDLVNFRNGDPIPQCKTTSDWELACSKGEPAWCYYNYDKTNAVKYGILYNWFAVKDSRGLAPKGWHIPSKDEWNDLSKLTGLAENQGEQLASPYWGTPAFDFRAIPSGCRCPPSGEYGDQEFNSINEGTVWWSSSLYNTGGEVLVTCFDLGRDKEAYNTLNEAGIPLNITLGASVRCVKD